LSWRLLLGLLVCYLAYRVAKSAYQSWISGGAASREARPDEPEVLVKDPVCGTFIPRREALKAQKDGQDYFFCSEGCLKRFRRSGTE
jgi:YHS domain-containing protein